MRPAATAVAGPCESSTAPEGGLRERDLASLVRVYLCRRGSSRSILDHQGTKGTHETDKWGMD
eukprot:4101298-Pyramimonas_sp.AAC.1